MEPKRLKRVVIKEELVELTGCFKKATILQQLLYWSERVKDFSKFIEEEENQLGSEHGWIYKNSDELSQETMLGLSPSNIRRHLKELIEAGLVEERNNPRYKWDKTKQYRINLNKIQIELNKIGFNLDGYGLQNNTVNFQNEKSGQQNERAIPEITTEITNRKKNDNVPQGFYEEVISYLNEKAGTRYNHKAKNSRTHISARYNEGFTLEDFKRVIDYKVAEWINNEKMRPYLRPATLFNQKMDWYLNQAGGERKSSKISIR